MSIWGIELEITFLLFAVSYPLALIFLVLHHSNRFGAFKGWSALLTTLTYLYICGVIAFTLFPLPVVTDHFCSLREEIDYWQLIPFSSVGDFSDVFREIGFPSILTSFVLLQIFFNVVLMMPLGMLLAYRYKKSLAFTVTAGFGLSLLIELTQGTAVFGVFGCPYRLADVDDLITNTTGTALGYLLARNLTSWLPDPDTAPE